MPQIIRTRSSNKQLIDIQRAKIAKCAAKAFAKNGYENTTVEDIAQSCAMSKGSVYYYVGSKEEILYLAIEYPFGELQELNKRLSENREGISVTERLKQIVRSYCEWQDKNQDMNVVAYQSMRQLGPKLRKRLLGMEAEIVIFVEKLLIKGCENGEFDIDPISTYFIAHDIVVGTEMWSFRRWILQKRYTLDEYIAQRTEVLLRALGVDRNKAK